MHKKHQRGDNSESIKTRAHFCMSHIVMSMYHQNIPNGNQVIERTRKCDGRTYVRTDRQTTDGRQAHRYISRTFRSGDKKAYNDQNDQSSKH